MVGKVLRAWLALCEQGYTPSHRMNLHLSNVGPVRAGIYHVDNSAPRQRLPCCPASTIFAGWRQSVLPVHLLGLAPLLGSVGPVAGDVNSRMTEWCTTRSIAAAVAMGLAKMRSHSEKTRFDVMPNDLRS